MDSALGIIAGRGALPRLLAEHCAQSGRACCVARLGPSESWHAGQTVIEARVERMGALFDGLRQAGCDQVVFAGGITRPTLDPARFDAITLAIMPRLLPEIGKGDDATLRAVAAIFDEAGFRVVAAHEVCPDLLAGAGALGQVAPSDADRRDMARAAAIVAALGAVDVGQAAIVAQGLCLGVETIQGTDHLLAFVADSSAGFRPDPTGAKGVLLKAPKPGQDLRMDLPAIGPDTVAGAARAGLAGIAVVAGQALLLERAETIAAADRLGLFLYGMAP